MIRRVTSSSLVGDDHLVEEGRQRQVGQRELRRDAFLAALRHHARKRVTAARRRGLGQQRLQIGKV